MPITTLNRVVAIFIVGAVPIAWLYIRNGGSLPNIGSLDTIAAGILLIPITALLGLVVEGAAELIRRPIKRILEGKYLWVFPLNRREFEHLQTWKASLAELGFVGLDETRSGSQFGATNFAAGYFLANASKEQIEWLNSHYSSYSLATSFTVLAAVMGFFDVHLFVYDLQWQLGEWIVIIGTIYLLLNIAVDSYIYSYHLAARFAVIHLMTSKS